MADKKDSPSALKNILELGERTTAKVVRANEEDHRDWLQEASLCPLLSTHQIIHAGLMKAYSPFEIVRTDQSGTFMLACIEGEGVILVDGSWK